MKLFKLLLLSLFTLLFVDTYGQTYTMSNTTVTTCSGTFYDSGGNGGQYANDEDYVFTICPGNGGLAQVSFASFNIENGWDFLTIYDGNSTAAPVIGTYSGTTSPGLITASTSNASGCLTFEFTSDFLNNEAGWKALISCTYGCQTVLSNVSLSPSPNGSGIIERCQGQSLNMNVSGSYPENGTYYTQSDATSTFDWYIKDSQGNVTHLSGQNVNYTFNDGGIYMVDVVITDANGCKSTNALQQIVHVGMDPIFSPTGPANNSICLGETNTLNGFATPQTDQLDCTPPVSGQTFLPDGSGVSYSTSVSVDCYGAAQTITNINQLTSICLNMEHSYAGDLNIAIKCPNGQTVNLVTYGSGVSPGGTYIGEPVDDDADLTAGNGYTYCFTNSPTYGTWDDEASTYTYTYTDNSGTTYTDHYYLPAGSYASEEALS